jgi:hypothetical protein
MNVRYTIHFTASDGSEAAITGDPRAVEEIEAIFARSRRVKFHDGSQTWDAGYYDETKRKTAS